MRQQRYMRPVAALTVAVLVLLGSAMAGSPSAGANILAKVKAVTTAADASTYQSPCVSRPTLTLGSSGEAVTFVQLRLQWKYPRLVADGYYGNNTAVAVWDFTKSSRIVNWDVWELLCGEEFIVVSQGSNAYALTAGKVVILQAGFIDNPDVLAKGAYNFRPDWSADPTWDATATGEAGNWRLDKYQGFAKGGTVGFHEIPKDKFTGESMHSESILGTNWAESHGCLRIGKKAASDLWWFTHDWASLAGHPWRATLQVYVI